MKQNVEPELKNFDMVAVNNSDLDSTIETFLIKENSLWMCKTCGKTHNDKQVMRFHVETHLTGISHPCNICGKSYRSRYSLRNHISTVHREK